MSIIETGFDVGIEWIIVKYYGSFGDFGDFFCYINFPNPNPDDSQIIVNDQWYWISSRPKFKGWLFLEDSTIKSIKQQLQEFLDSVMSSYEVGGQKYIECKNIVEKLK